MHSNRNTSKPEAVKTVAEVYNQLINKVNKEVSLACFSFFFSLICFSLFLHLTRLFLSLSPSHSPVSLSFSISLACFSLFLHLTRLFLSLSPSHLHVSLSLSVSLACFSIFLQILHGTVVCISPFVFYMYRYLSFSFYFSCVTCR